MSSPSEPDEMVSTSIERSFLPSFITEPLPNWRSIWESAADRALVLSMEDPSSIRRAVADIGWCSLWRGFASGTNGTAIGRQLLRETRKQALGQTCESLVDGTMYPICSQFAICSFGVWGRYIP